MLGADIGSWRLLDVCNDLVVAACSSPNQPHYLVSTAHSQLTGHVKVWCNKDMIRVIVGE